MAKIKLTKTELKRQRDALKQYSRYLPTLQLKKQQLQMEVQHTRDAVSKNLQEQQAFGERVSRWSRLMSRSDFSLVGELLKPGKLETDVKNIAGVDVPVFSRITFEEAVPDLFETPPWLDHAMESTRTLLELKLKGEILQEQQRLLEQELRTTTQRVNLFEKVKIPESKENIRVIQIYLGDQQTAAVGRSKIAKRKSVAQAEVQEVAS